MEHPDTPKTGKNLFIELAKRKAEAQAHGRRPGILGKELNSRFMPREKAQPKIRRGGRNGSGKP